MAKKITIIEPKYLKIVCLDEIIKLLLTHEANVTKIKYLSKMNDFEISLKSVETSNDNVS